MRTASTLLRQHLTEGNLKWRHMGTALGVLEMGSVGPVGQYMPRMERFNLFTGSDSILSMFTKGQGRPFASHWTTVAGLGIAALEARIVAALVPEDVTDPGLFDGPVPFTPRHVAELDRLAAL